MPSGRMHDSERRIDYQDPNALPRYLDEILRNNAEEARVLSPLNQVHRGARSKVMGLLFRRDFDRDKYPVLSVLKMMDEQMGSALQNTIQLRAGDTPLASREVIMESIMRELTPARAREILQFHEPMLVLVPAASLERYRLELIVASRIIQQAEAPFFSRFTELHLNEQARSSQVVGTQVKSWKFAITEGASVFDVPEWDNALNTSLDRTRLFTERFRESQMGMLSHRSYIALMVAGLKQNRTIDGRYYGKHKYHQSQSSQHFTYLDVSSETVILDEYSFFGICTAGWSDVPPQVFFRTASMSQSCDGARFRPMVDGHIVEES